MAIINADSQKSEHTVRYVLGRKQFIKICFIMKVQLVFIFRFCIV
jgi:hypothetical protein